MRWLRRRYLQFVKGWMMSDFNKTAFARIREYAADMAVDDQKSGLSCPNCNGGSNAELSLSVKRTANGVQYICHRNKCDWKGHIPMTAATLDPDRLYKEQKIYDGAKKYYGKLENLPANVSMQLQSKYGLTDEEITKAGWLWSPDMDGGRICMPIKARFGHNVGHSFRTLDKRKKPKNRIIITSTQEPLLCWYRCADEKSRGALTFTMPVVIVEDQISALKASRWCNAVALMGTNMNDQKVLELKKCLAPKFMLALDEDASVRAAELKRRYEDIFQSGLSVKLLKKDLKDSTDEEIKTALGMV